MNYAWPLDEIEKMLDVVPHHGSQAAVAAVLQARGLQSSLVDFLSPLYARADGATMYTGRIRLHPLYELPDADLPGLVEWNEETSWKLYEPQKVNRTFYFCSNAFGDQFGIPIDAEGRVLFDRIGVLWVERFEYQEAKIEWRLFFPRLAADESIAKFFLRLDEFDWAAGALGTPAAWQCFSSNVPALLGGSDTIDNVAVQPMAVHVSFTLQVIQQAKQQGTPGAPVPMVDLQGKDGKTVP